METQRGWPQFPFTVLHKERRVLWWAGFPLCCHQGSPPTSAVPVRVLKHLLAVTTSSFPAGTSIELEDQCLTTVVVYWMPDTLDWAIWTHSLNDSCSEVYSPPCSLFYCQLHLMIREWDILSLFQELELAICLGHTGAQYIAYCIKYGESPRQTEKNWNFFKKKFHYVIVILEAIFFSSKKRKEEKQVYPLEWKKDKTR